MKSTYLLIPLFFFYLFISWTIYSDNKESKQFTKNISKIINEGEVKARLIENMRLATINRSAILSKMYNTSDAFELDDLNQELNQMARNFIKAREKIYLMDLSTVELELLKHQDKLVKINAPKQNKVAQLLLNEKKDEAESLLYVETIPGQNGISSVLMKVSKIYSELSYNSFIKAQKQHRNASDKAESFLLKIVLFGFLILIVFIYIIRNEKNKVISQSNKLKELVGELEESKKELQLLASTDPMTKLYNRRYFVSMAESILDLAKRNKTTVSIIMLDIDKFKNVNDTYGHQVGDDVIISTAKMLQENSRKSDVVSRWGGEEFVILLSDTSIDGAMIIAEKIRVAIEKSTIHLQDGTMLKYTASFGVHQIINETYTDIEDSIDVADKALYDAKHSGRNTVSFKS